MSYQPMTQMQGQSNMRFVSIPKLESRADKGCTKYDDWFIHSLEHDEAIQIPQDEFDALRKAAFRFVRFRQLEVSIKQKKDARTRTMLLWFKRK